METALLIFAALLIGILIGFFIGRVTYRAEELPETLTAVTEPSVVSDIGLLVEDLALTSLSTSPVVTLSMTEEMTEIGVASTEDAIPPLNRMVQRAYISGDRPAVTGRETVGERRPVSRN